MTSTRQESIRVPLAPWEVGAELLDILSRGLYSDAKDALREYVQNGVDASANLIMISVDGPEVVIRDDGVGMNGETIRQVRRFGISAKSPKEMVGYRGIGIYAAFGICDEMSIMSRQADMTEMVGWTFHFKEMRDILEADKESEIRQGVALADLLYEHTELRSVPYDGDPRDHFTVVRLEGLEDEFRAQLNDASGVQDYLLNSIPVAFPDELYGSKVNRWLNEKLDLNPVRIVLRVGDEPEFEIAPLIESEVSEPAFEWISDSSGNHIAFIWYALSTTGRQVSSKSTSGFLMKLKGFTLGDRETLKPNWPGTGSRTLYHHYTGELHILEKADLYPNAARDDLEPSRHKQVFLRCFRDCADRLNRLADLTRAMHRASRLLEGLDETTETLIARQQNDNEDQFLIQKESLLYWQTLEKAKDELNRRVPKRKVRSGFRISDEQKERFEEIDGALATALRAVRSIYRATQSKTRPTEPNRTTPPPQKPPRQVTLLASATEGMRNMFESQPEERLSEALRSLEAAERLRTVQQAVATLDDLKASNYVLGPELETTRRDLRALLGWSPVAPVSLEEALSELNVSMDTEREVALIKLIDRGLIAGIGGRGEAYENAIRSIAESVAEEFAN